jgi:hypothetical protein
LFFRTLKVSFSIFHLARPQPASSTTVSGPTGRSVTKLFAVGGLAASVDDLASRPGESHPQALLEPYVKLSLHTAPDAQPPTDGVERPYLVPGLLPSPVGPGPRLSNAAPSVQSHCRTFNPTTSRSAPVPRIGTQALAVFATWASPLTSGRQVLTFHTRAWSGFAPPICRMPLRQASGPPPS